MSKQNEDRLAQMFRLQDELEQRTLKTEWTPPSEENWRPRLDMPGYVLRGGTQQWVTKWLGIWCTCLMQEIAELRDWTPWKHWSKQLGNKRTDVEPWTEEHVKEMQMEVVDAWHFLMAAALTLGMNADTFYRLYCEKNGINHERQDQGDY
jgi:hypothetical protein